MAKKYKTAFVVTFTHDQPIKQRDLAADIRDLYSAQTLKTAKNFKLTGKCPPIASITKVTVTPIGEK